MFEVTGLRLCSIVWQNLYHYIRYTYTTIQGVLLSQGFKRKPWKAHAKRRKKTYSDNWNNMVKIDENVENVAFWLLSQRNPSCGENPECWKIGRDGF